MIYSIYLVKDTNVVTKEKRSSSWSGTKCVAFFCFPQVRLSESQDGLLDFSWRKVWAEERYGKIVDWFLWRKRFKWVELKCCDDYHLCCCLSFLPTFVDVDQLSARNSWWRIWQPNRKKKILVLWSRHSLSSMLQRGIVVLRAIKCDDKSHIPSELKYRDRGFMYFPCAEFISFLRELDTSVIENANDHNLKRYGRQLVEVHRTCNHWIHSRIATHFHKLVEYRSSLETNQSILLAVHTNLKVIASIFFDKYFYSTYSSNWRVLVQLFRSGSKNCCITIFVWRKYKFMRVFVLPSFF